MNQTIQPAAIRKSLTVEAAPQKAFSVFTEGFDRWWPKSHSILASKTPQVAVTVEPRVGGRWYERGEDGSECDWGKVLSWDPPKRMVLKSGASAFRSNPPLRLS